MWQEFREFIARGSVVDLAVGVIIGAAFGKIVTSLVEDIVMPPIGLLLNGINFSDLFINLTPGNGTFPSVEAAKAAGAATINYGLFLNAVIQFLIVAFVIFLLVRSINRLRRQHEAPSEAPPTRDCPYCVSKIPLQATRCPYCTSDLRAELTP